MIANCLTDLVGWPAVAAIAVNGQVLKRRTAGVGVDDCVWTVTAESVMAARTVSGWLFKFKCNLNFKLHTGSKAGGGK